MSKNTKKATSSNIDPIIARARTMRPSARADFLHRHSVAEISEIHERLVGDAKPKTPRPILEKRILAALAEPAPEVDAKPIEEALAGSPAATANSASWDSAMPEPGYVPPAGTGDAGADDANDGPEHAPDGAAADEGREGAPDGAATDGAASSDGAAPTSDAAAPDAAPATPAATKERDARVPPVGTAIQKRDRQGNLRCECKVVDGGIEYAGKIYKTLSGAGLQASKDLGLATTTCDGLAFWGLKKAAPRPATTRDPIASLTGAWEKYRERAEAATKAAGGDDRAKIHDALSQHLTALNLLAAEVA